MRFFTFPLLRRGVWRRSAFLLLGVSTLTVATALAQEVREWRSAAGRPIKTSTNEKLVGTLRLDGDDEPGKVRIKMGGKTFRFTLSNLSEADRKYVAEQRAAQNGSQPAPAPKPEPAKPTPQPKPEPAQPTRTIVSNPAPALAEDASRALVAIPKDGVKRALLVGVDDYAEFADLKYAVADVEAIRERLIELGFKPENIVELKSTNPANLRPSQRYIRRQVDALLKAAGPNDLLFLHFSGHGFQTDGVVRFAPDDAVATGDENVLDPETTISLTEIIERLKTSEAKFKWLIVDACRENPTGTRSAAASARALKNIDPNKGVLVLQSCAEGELSFEDADAGRGLFTGRLLEAFDGKADFDGDGAISALDVCKYVSEQTLAASKTRFNATQTPYFSGEFSDFIVAEDLKIDGLTREDWARADSLYDEAHLLAEADNYEAALENINEALKIVVNVSQKNKTKIRYQERKTLLERLAAPDAVNDAYGKPTKTVRSVEELETTIKQASNGQVIQIVAGTYNLTQTIFVQRDKKISLVGATKNKNDVRLVLTGKEEIICLSNGAEIELADLTLETPEWGTIENNGGGVTALRCRMVNGKNTPILTHGVLTLTECEAVQNEKGNAIFASFGGSVNLKDCDITGGVGIGRDSAASTLTNCKIHNAKWTGVDIEGLWGGSDNPECNIVDCEIYDCNKGVCVQNRALATIIGGEIRNCKRDDYSSACESQSGTLKVQNVKIADCRYGVWCSGKAEFSNVEFDNLDEKYWVSQYDEKASLTINGEKIK